MIFSDNYIIFPDNQELIKAIVHFRSLIGDDENINVSPDVSTTAQDNFLHTRGNFEQHRFNAGILEPASQKFKSILEDPSQDLSVLDRTAMENSLGNVLSSMGQQTHESHFYDEAIAAFNRALEQLSQNDAPTEWATTQFNLGCAAQASGRLQSDSRLLKSSIDAFTEALVVWTREGAPEQWSMTMLQLGISFYEHGKLLKGNRTFQKAVVALKNALNCFDADNHALELAATHNCKGVVLHNLAESEENSERMEEALRSYETAITVCMEQQKPIHLAVLCRINRSTARAVLARLKNDPVIAEEAADEFEVILECFPHALQPLCVTRCEEQMAAAREMVASFA